MPPNSLRAGVPPISPGTVPSRICVLLVSSDLPNVAARVFDHSAAIAIGRVPWLFERHSTCLQGTLVSRVYVLDIKIEKCGHQVAEPNAAYHNQRVADFDDGRGISSQGSGRAECLLEELEQLGCVMNHEPRGHAVPTLRNSFCHRCSLAIAIETL